MRRLLVISGLCAICWRACDCDAAAIKGRVIDSAGQPVAAAEIRVWRKATAANGSLTNEPVSFANETKTLRADDAGRFTTPDLFDATVPLRVVAKAEGMLAGRSGWILPRQEAPEIDDLVLVHLSSIVGRVVDSQGAPVAGATVFNGDGHKRVEAKTGSTGKFFLEDVPENALFLFAEKPGYRFTGTLLGGKKSVDLRMLPSDELIEPLRTRQCILTDNERAALAHRLLDPYVEQVSREGKDVDKRRALYELAFSDPLAALGWLIKDDFQFAEACSFAALALSPVDAAMAEDVWNYAGKRRRDDRGFLDGRDRNAADVCFRLAGAAPDRALRVAATVAKPFWRAQARGAVARAMHGDTARKVLTEAAVDPELRDRALEVLVDHWNGDSATGLACLLPVAEVVAPTATHDLLWQALSLRPSRPTFNFLDDEAIVADFELAKMVARYEPALARELFLPAARELLRFGAPADAFYAVEAAAFVDPESAVELLGSMPDSLSASHVQPKNHARLNLVHVLGLERRRYWEYAGFWEPPE